MQHALHRNAHVRLIRPPHALVPGHGGLQLGQPGGAQQALDSGQLPRRPRRQGVRLLQDNQLSMCKRAAVSEAISLSSCTKRGCEGRWLQWHRFMLTVADFQFAARGAQSAVRIESR